jgi:ferritin-like metal-binding protein YciE
VELSQGMTIVRCGCIDPNRTREAAMGLFSKDIKNLADLYRHGLQDIYYAENRILKSLPAMIENASDGALKQGLEQHLVETEGQVHRLEEIFRLHDETPSGTKCPAIDGILKEGDDLMGEIEGNDVLNVGIVAAAQAVEHYEITRYGALIAWARELGHDNDAAILRRNLDEEKAADKKLTAMAERRVSPEPAKAAAGKPAPRRRRAKSRATGARAAASPRKTAQKNKTVQKKKTSRRK